MTTPYSWYQVVSDGPMTAPRWYHHILIKLFAQHTAPAFWLLVVAALAGLMPPIPLAAPIALIAGPGIYAGIIASKVYRRCVPNWADWIHDSAFAFAVFAGGLILAGDHRGGLLLLGACVATWRQLHRRAVP